MRTPIKQTNYSTKIVHRASQIQLKYTINNREPVQREAIQRTILAKTVYRIMISLPEDFESYGYKENAAKTFEGFIQARH